MPKTIIQIKTYICPLGLGNPDGECRFHRSVDNLPEDKKCPVHKLKLVKTTDPKDKITITIIGEDEVEDFIRHDNVIRRKALADQIDTEETNTANREGRMPKPKNREPLTVVEKNKLIDKIRSDIAKFKALEDKSPIG